MEIINIYKKLCNNSNTITQEDALEFIYKVLDKFNPNYNRHILETGLSMGLLPSTLKACINIVDNNPSLFNIQTLKIYKDNYLLKIIIKKLK